MRICIAVRSRTSSRLLALLLTVSATYAFAARRNATLTVTFQRNGRCHSVIRRRLERIDHYHDAEFIPVS